MKTIGILAAITSLGMLTAAAQTQETPPQPASPNAPVATEATVSPPRAATGKPTIVTVKPKPSRLVQALDSNQDGKLSVEEIEAAVAILKGLDQDGNGELTSDEFGPVVAAEKPTSRSILRPTNPSKPSTINRPNRPGRRPTAKPTRPGTRPARVATSKNPPSRLKRPSGRPRPAGRPV
ncbi:MAG: EF-hand domain-containing protein, partial [Opitutales bacterium]|nr:EF-hand domain-containing protein [Opitutales bacterium]